MKDGKEQRKIIEIEHKISLALNKLGLSFAEAFGIVTYNPRVKTACWKYSTLTGEESIEIGDMVADLPVELIEMVLRHEFLHRSVFHGFGEQFDDREISNITLDICINRLLFEAFPEQMSRLSQKIYPDASKKTIIALADCSADPFELNDNLRSLWRTIWMKDADGRFSHLNPASLYFRLVTLHEKICIELNPFSDLSDIQSDGIPDRIVRAGSKIAEEISARLPHGSSGGQGLNRYSVIPRQIGFNNVELFLKRINVRTVATHFASKIKEPLERRTFQQPYPMFPSRIGLIYQALGIADNLRIYHNRDVTSSGVRQAIAIYVDVSGSMIRHFPLISGFIDALKDYPLRMCAFDTAVREIELEEFANGNITGGGGTEFDCVIRDLLDRNDIVAAVIFSDGEGSLSDQLYKSLKLSGKYVYTVFIRADNEISSVLRKISRDCLMLDVRDSKYIINKSLYGQPKSA